MLPGAKVAEKAEELYSKLTVGWGAGGQEREFHIRGNKTYHLLKEWEWKVMVKYLESC